MPAPRLLFRIYIRTYPKAILLLILLWHQHLSWRNDCWPGVTRLATVTGWSKRKVYQALHEMGSVQEWTKLDLGLPRPLDITWRTNKYGQPSRHFQVRAIVYHRKQGRGYTTFAITKEFADAFSVNTAVEPTRVEITDEGN
jgi:hypothetical protein